jgi:hypothetical protein
MRKLLLVVASLVAGCPGPTVVPPNNNNNNNNGVGETCTIDTSTTIPKPSSTDVPKRSDGKSIDRSCVGTPAVIASPTSTTATVQGCIKIFGIGNLAKAGIMVSIFDINQDPKKDTPTYGSTTIATQADAQGKDCTGADAGTAACIALGCDSQGAYSLDNVALHVPVIVKVSLPGDQTVIDSYSYDELFDGPNQVAPDANGVVSYVANLIYDSTYSSIPTLAGQQVDGSGNTTDGIGRGVVAGEVRDCTDTEVQGASVTSDQMDSSTKVTYFNGDTNNEQPDITRTSTNSDGVFVILNANTDPGKNTPTVSAGILDPSCAGTDSCQCVAMGSRQIKTFADAVTIVTFRGDLPTLQ